MILAMMQAQNAVEGDGPTAAPDAPSASLYQTNLVFLQWSNNGDAVSQSQILRDGFVWQTLSPGSRNYETGESVGEYDAETWTVRHLRNGQTSAAVTFPPVLSGGGQL